MIKEQIIKVIKKWELILREDNNKNITYGRKVLEEMLTDVKIAVKNNPRKSKL